MPAGVLRRPAPLVFELSADVDFSSPETWPFWRFTFTPDAPEKVMEVSIVGTVVGPSKVGVVAYWGPNDVGKLAPESQLDGFDDPAPGAQAITVGTLAPSPVPKAYSGNGDLMGYNWMGTSQLTSSVKLTGLTPGVVCAVEITCGIVGSSMQTQVADASYAGGAGRFAFAEWEKKDGSGRMVVRALNGAWTSIVRVGQMPYRPLDDLLVTLPVPSADGYAAFAPDCSRAIVSNLLDNSVTILRDVRETWKWRNADRAESWDVQGTYPYPTAAKYPCGVSCQPDGTTAWVATYGDTIRQINLTTGAWGQEWPLAASSGCLELALIPLQRDLRDSGGIEGTDFLRPTNSTEALVVCSSSGKLAKVNLATGAVTYTPVLGGTNQAPQDVAVTRDGTKAWVMCQTNFAAYEVNVADMTLTGYYAQGVTGAGHSVALAPDDRALFTAWNDTPGPGAGNDGGWLTHHNLGTEDGHPFPYVHWPNMLGAHSARNPDYGNQVGWLRCSPATGAIYMSASDDKFVNYWHSSRFLIRPANTIHGEFARATIT